MDYLKLAVDKAWRNHCFNILGINKLTPKTLKTAYKHMCKIYHPDNKETGDKEKFIILQRAYETLKKELIKTIVIKYSVEDIIKGKCEYECCDRRFNITIKNFNKFLKPYTFTHLNQNYKVVFKFIPSNGYKIYKKNKKYYIEKSLDITFTDIKRGYVEIDCGDYICKFNIPRKGVLENILKITADIYFKLCYNIVV